VEILLQLAVSYKDDALDVYGVEHSLVFDPMLRDAFAPFVMHVAR
jgi:hypothetical protein